MEAGKRMLHDGDYSLQRVRDHAAASREAMRDANWGAALDQAKQAAMAAGEANALYEMAWDVAGEKVSKARRTRMKNAEKNLASLFEKIWDQIEETRIS